MKRLNQGLGSFTLVISISLFFLGYLAGETTSSGNHFFAPSDHAQNELVSDSSDLNFDGLLQRQSGNQKIPNLPRGPVFFDGMSFLFEHEKLLNQGKYSPGYFCFFSTTDLSVEYHNLRI